MSERTIISGVSRIPIIISGNWSSPPERDWRGVASANEPIVAVLFLCSRNHVAWSLSSSTDKTSIETRLVLFPYDKAELDVQVNVTIGGGVLRSRSFVVSPTYLPNMPAQSSVEAGEVVLLATIEGQPSVEFMGLFLAKHDTQVGRKHIWHLRPPYRDALPLVLRDPLTYGRTGEYNV